MLNRKFRICILTSKITHSSVFYSTIVWETGFEYMVELLGWYDSVLWVVW